MLHFLQFYYISKIYLKICCLFYILKLIENETVKISYTGKFFKENFDEVYVHFGFGDNWDNLSEIKMNKTELGFQAEISLVSTENLNLCFRTNTNEWDNNSGSNYSFHIEPVSVAMVAVDKPVSVAMVAIDNVNSILPRKLRKTYIWSKKVKLAIYKMFRYLPKLISGNYFGKKINESE